MVTRREVFAFNIYLEESLENGLSMPEAIEKARNRLILDLFNGAVEAVLCNPDADMSDALRFGFQVLKARHPKM